MRFHHILPLLAIVATWVPVVPAVATTTITEPPALWDVSTLAAEENVARPESSCDREPIPFDPLIHKEKYVVSVHAIRGIDTALKEYNLTFSEYLTKTAGKRFDPPVEFVTEPQDNMEDIFERIDEDEIDFLYVNSGMYSCVGVEYGALPLATIISRLEVRGITYDLDVFGGVIFTRSDRYDINTVDDLKDKVIGAGAITMINAGQVQFHVMVKAGLSYIMDPKQVVFTFNQGLVVAGVLSGEFDVGFVRTDTIERTTDEDGKSIDMDLIKIINPQVYVMDDGKIFPFLHSTDIYAEWPVAALPHVDKEVAMEVQSALFALQDNAEIGRKIAEGATFVTAGCSVTEEIAELAFAASVAGSLAGFRNPRSYFDVRSMHEAAMLITKDERGEWSCTRAENLYDAFECPADHYKLPVDQYEQKCASEGLPCKDGYSCYCKPCIEAFEVEVFSCEHNDTYFHQSSEERHVGCDKMSLCGTVEQTKDIQFRIRDNEKRADAEVAVKVHVGGITKEVPVTKVSDFNYKFLWSNNEIGAAIMEVEVDGVQIPQSPLRIEVVERSCDLDFPGANKEPSSDGECLCADNTVDIRGKCISSTIFAVVASIAFLVIAFICGAFYIRYKNHKADQMWIVGVEELHFDDPVEVIGQGSFGVVLLAEYRGTKVAIKRAIKTSGKKGSTKRSRGSITGKRSAASKTSKGPGSKAGSKSGGSRAGSKDAGHSGSIASVGSHSHHSCEDTSDEYVDPEKNAGIQSRDSTGSNTRSRSCSVSWMADDFRRSHRWDWLFPWKKQDDYQSRFRDTILGESGSSSHRSLVAVLFPWCNEQARREEEFMAEMRVLSRLRHPCITTVMGAVVSHNHDPMLVMEYMENGSLYDLLRNDTMFLSGEIILQICRDIAQGLRYLHSSKPQTLHGDLKARNILIDARFRAKLCDFGLSNKNHNLITGTPYWMAPEYLTGKSSYNSTCDMYSIGIILYEMYSRKTPYEGEHFKTVLRKVCDRRVNKRPDIPDTTPPKMAELMKKLWSPDPFFRPQAINLDMMLMEMTSRDTEPLETDKGGRRTGDMFYELFPKHIAEALKAGKKVEPEQHDLVTVVFSEIIDFQELAREISPMKVTDMLDRLYLKFDRLAKKHEIFKVETVGDNFMGTTNLEGNQENTHVKHVAEFAIEMISEASQTLIDEENPQKGFVSIRVGFHSGSVVTNVIGSLNPRYGLFGDTVNTASRMESNSKPNRVLCSEYSHTMLKEQAPDITTHKRGKINVKGKGPMTVYWIGDRLESEGKLAAQQQDGKRVGFEGDDDSVAHSASAGRSGSMARK